jgi:uncharacterized protein YcnI
MHVLRPLVVAAGVVIALIAPTSALAHGTLTPVTAAAGSSQQFELTVPNDRLDADIVGVTLRLPAGFGLEAATAEQPRWSVASSGGEIVWRGGPISRASAESFEFTARVPADPGAVELTLVETYDDGEAAPFPIGMSVTGTAATTESDTLEVAAFVVSVLALGIASAALVVGLRAGRRPSGP